MEFKRKRTLYEMIFKRLFDFLLSLIGIIVLSPLLLVLAILVRTKLGSPIIFKQPRSGKNGKVFNVYKFRSMTNKKDENGNLLPDENRLTKFGRALRKTSLDELPQLFNILIGQMSIVGPRPQLARYVELYDEHQNKKHLVRPGLTGLAQVNGRNNIDWGERLNYDVEYVEKITIFKDIKILFKTVGIVFKAKDVNQEGNETYEDFADYLLRQNKITEEEYEAHFEKHLNGGNK